MGARRDHNALASVALYIIKVYHHCPNTEGGWVEKLLEQLEDLVTRTVVDAVVEVKDLLHAGFGRRLLAVDPVVAFVQLGPEVDVIVY